MKKTRVYDLPTRLFHWTFAGLFLVAFGIAKLIDDDSPVYSYHMLLGFLLSAAVIWRIGWGFVGSRYARFNSFKLNPKDLLAYFIDFFKPNSKRFVGHNPASSWAAITMFALALGLGFTGYMMVQGVAKDFYEDIHELLANTFIIVVVFHISGVLLHSLRHRDALALSMINGKKDETEVAAGISKSHYFAALFFIAFMGSFAFSLFKNYDSNSQNLNLLGTTLQLGDSEGEVGGHDDDGDDD